MNSCYLFFAENVPTFQEFLTGVPLFLIWVGLRKKKKSRKHRDFRDFAPYYAFTTHAILVVFDKHFKVGLRMTANRTFRRSNR